MHALQVRWKWLLAVAIALLVVLRLLGPRYGELQLVDDAERFRQLVGTSGGRYVGAAIVDMVFAATYGLLGLAGYHAGVTQRIVAAKVGGALTALGASLDEIENAILVVNIARRDTLDDAGVALLGVPGAAKWAAVLVGIPLLVAAVLWHDQRVRTWIGRSRAPYTLFVVSLLLMVPAAGLRSRAAVWALVVALAAVAAWLNYSVGVDRASDAPSGVARRMLALVQLVVGSVLITTGRNALLFLGIALVIMSLGALVSELRQSTTWKGRRGVVLLVVALGAALAGAVVEAPPVAIGLIAVAALAGEVGTELFSHDAGRWSHTLRCLIAGLVTLAISFAVFVSGGVDPAHALAILAVAGFMALAASMDTDALLIVLVVAVALVWATTPREVDPDPALQPNKTAPYSVVLGDSYISGEGASEFIKGSNTKAPDDPNESFTHECRRADTAWPLELARFGGRHIVGRVAFLACSGAVAANIHTAPRMNAEGERQGPAELDLLLRKKDDIGFEPAFVVVSVGGNDAGFGVIGRTCVGPGNCAGLGQQFLDGLEKVGPLLDGVYDRVFAAVGDDVPVVATPYPMPITDAGRCRGALLEDDERRFIRGFVTELNAVVEAAAARSGVHYLADMSTALDDGKQLCGAAAGSVGLNFLALNPTGGSVADSLDPRNWTHNSLHPNADGHRAMVAAAGRWFGEQEVLDRLPQRPDTEHTVRRLSEVMTKPPTQCDQRTDDDCQVAGERWLIAQAHDTYRTGLLPFVLALVGTWLVCAPVLGWLRRNNVTTAHVTFAVLRRVCGRVPPDHDGAARAARDHEITSSTRTSR